MRKVLVTDAAGFIGFHLTRRLLEGGYNRNNDIFAIRGESLYLTETLLVNV